MLRFTASISSARLRQLRHTITVHILSHWIGLLAAIAVIGLISEQFLHGVSLFIAPALLFISLYRRHREIILMAAGFGLFALHLNSRPRALFLASAPEYRDSLFISGGSIALLSMICAFILILIAAGSKKLAVKNPWRRSSMVLVLAMMIALLASLGPIAARGPSVGWGAMTVWLLGLHFWFFAYDLQDDPNGKLKTSLSQDGATPLPSHPPKGTPSLWRKLGYYRPFWCLIYIAPMPRGESTLRSIECQQLEEFRSSQARGLTLILWAFLLLMAQRGLLLWAFSATELPIFSWRVGWQLPTVARALEMVAHGERIHLLKMWGIVFAEFFQHLAYLAAAGHLIIGIARFAGYLAPRNTYRPLTSTTFVEFFNRYNYYYKELLVQIFYYPAFFGPLKRWFKNWPHVRIFAAVGLSAGLGNFIAHIFLHSDEYLRDGFGTGLIRFAPYGFYCLLLSMAVAFSQINQLRDHPWAFGELGIFKHCSLATRQVLGRGLAIVFVLTFFAVLRLFDDVFAGNIRNNLRLVACAFGLPFI